MAQSLKIIAWNANDLAQHMNEVKIFIFNNQTDIMLISETHFTKNIISKYRFTQYTIQHPNGTAHSGTAIIIKNNI